MKNFYAILGSLLLIFISTIGFGQQDNPLGNEHNATLTAIFKELPTTDKINEIKGGDIDASEYTHTLDSICETRLNPETGENEIFKIKTFTYNSFGQKTQEIISHIRQNCNDRKGHHPNMMLKWEYNDFNMLQQHQVFIQSKQSDEYFLEKEENYTYTEAGLLAGYELIKYMPNTEPIFKLTASYNDFEKITEAHHYVYNMTDGSFLLMDRLVFNYNENNACELIERFVHFQGEDKLVAKRTIAYNEDLKVSEWISYFKKPFLEEFLPFAKCTFTYSSDTDFAEGYIYSFIDENWTLFTKEETSFNANNQKTYHKKEVILPIDPENWHGFIEEWTYDGEYLLSQTKTDLDGNPIRSKSYLYDDNYNLIDFTLLAEGKGCNQDLRGDNCNGGNGNGGCGNGNGGNGHGNGNGGNGHGNGNGGNGHGNGNGGNGHGNGNGGNGHGNGHGNGNHPMKGQSHKLTNFQYNEDLNNVNVALPWINKHMFLNNTNAVLSCEKQKAVKEGEEWNFQPFSSITFYYSTVENFFVGVQEMEDNSLHCFPNPATNFIHVKTKGLEKGGKFKLINEQGVVVMQQDVDFDQQFDISDLPQGLYIYQYQNGEKNIQDKIIIQ